MNILGLPILWSSGINLGYNQWFSQEKNKTKQNKAKKKQPEKTPKTKIKHKPCRHLTCLFFERCLLKSWMDMIFIEKNKLFWDSLDYHCYGFGITSQLPCVTYSLVTLGWIGAYGIESSPASSLQGPWRGNHDCVHRSVQLWFTCAGSHSSGVLQSTAQRVNLDTASEQQHQVMQSQQPFLTTLTK